MDVLAGYGSDNDSGLSSKLTPTKNKEQPSTGISESQAREDKLAAEWESFQALLGDDVFSKEEGENSKTEVTLPDVVPPSESPSAARKRSKSKSPVLDKKKSKASSASESSDSSSTSSESDSSDSEKERKRRKKKASRKKASRSKSKKKKKHRKRESSSSESSSSEESDSDKDDDDEEEEDEKKAKKTNKTIPMETSASKISPEKEIDRDRSTSPSRRTSQSENPEKSSTVQVKQNYDLKRSHSRSRSRERKRSRSRSRERRRRSRSRSKDRKRRSRSRGRRRRSRSRDRKRRSRSRDRHRRYRSRSKGRKRRRSRDRRRSRSRSHGKRRRSRSRSRDRRRHSPKRGSHRRERERDIKRDRPKPEPPSLLSKSNQPLTFKEQLKQNLIAVQKQAAEGGLALDPAAEEKLRQIAQKAQEKNNQALMNETAQLSNIARTQAGQMTPQLALMQTMAAMQQKAQELTGVAVPKYYNPAAVNPLKYAEQVKKRKMLWSRPEEQKQKEPDSEVMLKSSSFGEDKTTAKFRKLMGIKAGESEQNLMSEEQKKKQEEIFSRLDKEYEFARMATHTHRGVGLGTLSHAYPPGVQAPVNPPQQEPPK